MDTSKIPITSTDYGGIGIQQAVPGRLRSLLRGQPEPILLLGAGASISSGIPAAAETVEKIARWRWCLDNDRYFNDPSVRRADYWPWLMAQSWFSPDTNLADLYPDAVKYLLNVASDRRSFFENLINPAVSPNRGYVGLANILHQGWISTVLTTNFDECLQKAQIRINRPHYLVTIKTPSDLVRFSSVPDNPQLVYLHGSVEHLTDKNLLEDVRNIDSDIIDRVKPLLRDHPIIVAGYRGAEPSIMDGLFLQNIDYTTKFYRGVWWCVLERELDKPLPPLVEKFATSIGGNFNKVPIKNFDDLFELDLWKKLVADGAQPARRSHAYRATELPADMAAVDDATFEDLDLILLFTRLREYAGVSNTWAPDSYDQDWTINTATSFNLLLNQDTHSRPTLAGWLLFAHKPSTLGENAYVRFSAEGPERWLRQCFGDDVELIFEDTEVYRVESEVRGNLWSQLDQLTDLLSLINRQFRLKQEVSRQVRAYSPLALKEMLVNALVHRDYSSENPVIIRATPSQITTESPGGLVETVTSQIFDQDLESLIKSGLRSIKGYRNPVISDLFYGGGQMDHTGSGLSDMWKETVNNNGNVDFGPTQGNSSFLVAIQARPEAVDEFTNTALAQEREVTRFTSNILPFHSLPTHIWHAGTTATYTGALFKSAKDLTLPPGHVENGRFFSLYNLRDIIESFVTPFDIGDVESLSVDELLEQPNGENIFIKLTIDAVLEHCRALGLQIDYKRKRAHFPRQEEDNERKITYQGRFKRATRTVVKARMKRDSLDISYYEHKALSISVMRFGEEWAIILTPGYAFTRNGFGRLIGNEMINSLSTRRAAKDFNSNVHHDLTFWLTILRDQVEGVFALKPNIAEFLQPFFPTILLSSQLPSISYNSAAFEETDLQEHNPDEDLDELDHEISALVERAEEIEKVVLGEDMSSRLDQEALDD